ncbi:MAG: hypothetical protein KUG69_04285 [Marinosulfonomonas sp.]|nr:hypothetical protein [Marinosulfonomonas sp.]
MNDGVSLKADCSQCQALCCVALAFDRSDMFAIDKPAGVACPNLTPDYGCKIHAKLGELGFSGCQRYDCLGAGQRIVNEVFPDIDWMKATLHLPVIMESFAAMRKVHELLELLFTAQKLPLSRKDGATCLQLIAELSPASGWQAETLREFGDSDIRQRVDVFVKGLRNLPKFRIQAQK